MSKKPALTCGYIAVKGGFCGCRQGTSVAAPSPEATYKAIVDAVAPEG